MMPIEILQIETVEMECGECGVMFWVTNSFYQERRKRNIGWTCPNGHNRIFKESDVDILKRQIKEEQSKLASAQFELMVASKKIKRIEKRVKNGSCPCCKRSFVQLERHMKTKHPDYAVT
jgi:hypothetical protein